MSFPRNQFATGRDARVKNVGLSTIPKIIDDYRYCFAAASWTILRTAGSS
jgi:hypothetical protein